MNEIDSITSDSRLAIAGAPARTSAEQKVWRAACQFFAQEFSIYTETENRCTTCIRCTSCSGPAAARFAIGSKDNALYLSVEAPLTDKKCFLFREGKPWFAFTAKRGERVVHIGWIVNSGHFVLKGKTQLDETFHVMTGQRSESS